jgi:CRISPR/Cas system-associated endoribonuclease Cas2
MPLRFFNETIGKYLPTPKQIVPNGYTETTFQHRTSKQRQLRFNQLLYELKRDGLVVGNTGKNSLLNITARGLLWLKKFKDGPPIELPHYTKPAERNSRVTIISYDIPEKLASLRSWLRSSLKTLGMTAIQQSVFIGKIKVPSDLLQLVVQLKLETYIEIFEITKAGTLRQRLQEKY